MSFLAFVILYAVAVLGYCVVGTYMLFRRDTRLQTDFAVFCFVLGFWQLVQLLAQVFYQNHEVAIFFMRSSAFLGAYVGVWFLYFAFGYTKHCPPYKSLFAVGTIVALLTLFSTGLRHAVVTQSGFTIDPIDPFYGSVLVFGALAAGTGTIAIIRNYLQHRRGFHRHDTLLVFGILVAIVAIMVISSVSSSNLAAQLIAPLTCLFALALVAYALVFQGYFDLRIMAVRGVGYLASVLTMALLYGVVIYLLAAFVFRLELPPETQIYLSVATGVLGLSFRRLKQVFDRMTNRIFYRDAYDPEALFDRLNRMLVSSINIDFLLKRTSEIIGDSLKVQFIFFELKDTSSETYRRIGDGATDISAADRATMRALAAGINQPVIVADYLEQSHDKLRTLLKDNDIAALVRLSPGRYRDSEDLGLIVLGDKKSGNTYTLQDVATLESVSKELLLAIQNSLHFEEIQRFNAVLQVRVDNATRKLRASNEKLEALDETKDDFISMASHQLRTPLTSVKGYLSMVLDGDAGRINETQKKMLGQAFVSSQRMVYLIADLLNVSRLKTGKFMIDTAPTNLSKVISEEVAQLIETAESRSIELTYVPPVTFPILPLDETKTRQVIMNFIDNAIYYTPPGGHIRIELTDTPATVELRVVDDGIGVPKAEQRHLFTKFYRAGNARKARPDGTGLGLFMAKKVILAQGGSLIFESKEGKGSTFGFAFSKSRLKAATAAAVPPVAQKAPHPAAVKA